MNGLKRCPGLHLHRIKSSRVRVVQSGVSDVDELAGQVSVTLVLERLPQLLAKPTRVVSEELVERRASPQGSVRFVFVESDVDLLLGDGSARGDLPVELPYVLLVGRDLFAVEQAGGLRCFVYRHVLVVGSICRPVLFLEQFGLNVI